MLCNYCRIEEWQKAELSAWFEKRERSLRKFVGNIDKLIAGCRSGIDQRCEGIVKPKIVYRCHAKECSCGYCVDNVYKN